jgi:hypothetical protein
MEAQDTPNSTMANRILLETSNQKGKPRSIMGPLRVVIESVQAWGELYKLIGGSQVISTKVTSVRQSPQKLEAPNYLLPSHNTTKGQQAI